MRTYIKTIETNGQLTTLAGDPIIQVKATKDARMAVVVNGINLGYVYKESNSRKWYAVRGGKQHSTARESKRAAIEALLITE